MKRFVAIALMMGSMMIGGTPAMAYETADYETLREDIARSLSVRRYAPALVVQVDAEANTPTHNEAFRLLFNYIQGANTTSATVAMTVPVTTAPETQGQKIAMTVPVTTTPEGSSGPAMRFYLPRSLTLETAPKPTDPRVSMEKLPAENMAVISFSGFGRKALMHKKEEELRTWVKQEGMTPTGPARWVYYNSPFTLPWNRTNEVWIPVDIE